MKLVITSPLVSLAHDEVAKIRAEGPEGHFCLLPRHIDFVSTLVPGILSYTTVEGTEGFVAIDEGFLVKKGGEVLVSVRSASEGQELGELRRAVVEDFEALEDEERKARETLARLEADFMRRFGKGA